MGGDGLLKDRFMIIPLQLVNLVTLNSLNKNLDVSCVL